MIYYKYMPKKKINIAVPDLSPLEKKYLNQAYDSTWISSTGKFVDKFEKKFAKICGVKHAIAVTNGTVAIHLALLAYDVKPGDEIIVPSFTYIATANAVKYVGATPIFVDVDEDNWCMDPQKIEKIITPKTKGIIAVNLYGHPADMDEINKIAKKHKLFVIEDAAESHTATYKGIPTGGLGNIGTFSFYGNKIFTSGEGGAITLNDDKLAEKIRILKGQGMDPNRRYFFLVIGYNYRMTNLSAAIATAQLERKTEILKKRNSIFKLYTEQLSEIEGISLQPKKDWATIAPWFYSITIDSKKYGMSRDNLMNLLEKKGVETRPFFIPIHSLPPYKKEYKSVDKDLPVTNKLSKIGMNLPTHNNLTANDIEYICKLIKVKK